MAPRTEEVDGDDEMPSLPLDSLAMVHEILRSRTAEVTEVEPKDPYTMSRFDEDWNASQFWYSEETAETLARAVLKGATSETRVAVISAPSVYVKIKSIAASLPPDRVPQMKLLEFDRRFAVYEDFVFYDYNEPLQLPSGLQSGFDVLVIDPPFLNEDCQSNTAKTADFLAGIRTDVLGNKPRTRVLICTGERMQSLIVRLYKPYGVRTTDFSPVHAKGLANEFACYANFEANSWKYQD